MYKWTLYRGNDDKERKHLFHYRTELEHEKKILPGESSKRFSGLQKKALWSQQADNDGTSVFSLTEDKDDSAALELED